MSEVLVPIERRWKSAKKVGLMYFYAWIDVLLEEYGRERTIELWRKFGEKVGKASAELYLKAGINPNDLSSWVNIVQRTAEIVSEDTRLSIEDGKLVQRTWSCPTGDWARQRGLERGCVEYCDANLEALAKGVNPRIKTTKAIRNIFDNGVCERVWTLE